MAQLSSVIGSILRDIVSAQHEANLYSLSLGDSYGKDGKAKDFQLPNVMVSDMELDLKKAASVSSLPPFFKGYFVGLPNRYTFFYRQEHRVFFCHVECLIPSTDLRQCTVYAPFAQ